MKPSVKLVGFLPDTVEEEERVGNVLHPIHSYEHNVIRQHHKRRRGEENALGIQWA